MIARFWNYLDLAVAYIRFNLKSQMEYRGAFISQIAAMILNDGVWVAFWVLYFTRFPVLRGWGVEDVMTIWALTASGFGLAHALYGNVIFLPFLIIQGQLDAWMLYPRALLPHMLLGKMNATAWGDALFGYGVYFLLVQPDLIHALMFICLTISCATLFIGFGILAGSLAFFVGNAANLTEQWRISLITFSTYPSILFEGLVKILLFTLIPAGFVTHFPIQVLRHLSLLDGIFTLGGALGFLLLSIIVFHLGLRRYESGNLTEMRG